MGKVVLAFSMSLDGYVAGPDISAGDAMGRGGERLHEWMFAADMDEADREVVREMRESVGAVILGRRTFDLGLQHWGDTPYPVPSFVLTHETRPPLPMKSASFTFVTEGVESAVRQAKAAAGGKDVVVMGAGAAQSVLNAGLADALNLQLVPVLLGGGTRLFDNLGADQIELRRTRLIGTPAVTHLGFEISGEKNT
jgi:dihydrofolate reductase